MTFNLAFVPHTDSSRCCWSNLITGGRDGSICCWPIEPVDSRDEDSAGDPKVSQVTYSGGHLVPVWCCALSLKLQVDQRFTDSISLE